VIKKDRADHGGEKTPSLLLGKDPQIEQRQQFAWQEGDGEYNYGLMREEGGQP